MEIIDPVLLRKKYLNEKGKIDFSTLSELESFFNEAVKYASQIVYKSMFDKLDGNPNVSQHGYRSRMENAYYVKAQSGSFVTALRRCINPYSEKVPGRVSDFFESVMESRNWNDTGDLKLQFFTYHNSRNFGTTDHPLENKLVPIGNIAGSAKRISRSVLNELTKEFMVKKGQKMLERETTISEDIGNLQDIFDESRKIIDQMQIENRKASSIVDGLINVQTELEKDELHVAAS